MAGKLTFNDIKYAELEPTKLNYDATTPAALGTGTVDPSGDAVVGALYTNTVSGDLFRKISAGASAGAWQKISSISTIILQNRYRQLNINSAVTATDATSPAVGDLVGFCGVGAWATSGALSAAKTYIAGSGAQNAAFVAGGFTASYVRLTELFNGSTWTSGNNLSVSKSSMACSGSQYSGFVTGGAVNAASASTTDLFNGSSWSLSNPLSIAKQFPAGAGAQNSGLVAGGYTTLETNATEMFNGTSWAVSGTLSTAKSTMAGIGSQNAAVVAGGNTGGNQTNATEIFNGTVWTTSGILSAVKQNASGGGSQIASFITGGGSAVSELFNGSSWYTSGNLSTIKQNSARAGSQNAGLIAGGSDGAVTAVTELHSQTIFRKIYGKNIPEAKNLGILSATNTVMIQGTNASVTYPANKYLVLNRTLNSSVTNYANTTAIAFVSVQGTPPTMTYNFSSTVNILAVVPGNIAVIPASGSVSVTNTGSFVISRVISPSSIELQNANGVAENPITGTLTIINSMIAVDTISAQDIVVGKTDAAGLLTVQAPLVAGSLIKRLK